MKRFPEPYMDSNCYSAMGSHNQSAFFRQSRQIAGIPDAHDPSAQKRNANKAAKIWHFRDVVHSNNCVVRILDKFGAIPRTLTLKTREYPTHRWVPETPSQVREHRLRSTMRDLRGQQLGKSLSRAPKSLAPWSLGTRKLFKILYSQSKCFFLGPMSSSVVALHTDFARPWPARLCLAASNLSLIVCPAIFTLILGRGVCTEKGPAQRPTDKSHSFRHRRLWRTAHSALTQLQLPSGAPLTKMASDKSRRTLSAHVTAPPKQLDFQCSMMKYRLAPVTF